MTGFPAGFPIVCVLLDGLGDWPAAELGGQTPLEAASTPALDAVAAAGANALLYPLGPGRAPSSERAQWEYLGYPARDFPGRAVLEAEGGGHAVADGQSLVHLALRSARREGAALRLQDWHREPEDAVDCERLVHALGTPTFSGVTFRLRYLERGDAVVFLDGAGSGDVTDSDPFSTPHPVLAVQARAEAEDPREAQRTASALNAYLRYCHRLLERQVVNQQRHRDGKLPLNCAVTKWSGRRRNVAALSDHAGGATAFVASTSLYRGFARSLRGQFVAVAEDEPASELAAKVEQARRLVTDGYAFVYVHTKAADEAGHRKDPAHKQAVIAALDDGLRELPALRERAIVAVTADHATPSWGPALHSGDGVPLAVAGPSVGVDSVTTFGERTAAAGALGTLWGADLLPLLVNLAGRARFRGSRHSSRPALAPPADPHLLDVSGDAAAMGA